MVERAALARPQRVRAHPPHRLPDRGDPRPSRPAHRRRPPDRGGGRHLDLADDSTAVHRGLRRRCDALRDAADRARSRVPAWRRTRPRKPLSIPDLASDDRFPTFVARALEEGLVAVFTFPLRDGDRVRARWTFIAGVPERSAPVRCRRHRPWRTSRPPTCTRPGSRRPESGLRGRARRRRARAGARPGQERLRGHRQPRAADTDDQHLRLCRAAPGPLGWRPDPGAEQLRRRHQPQQRPTQEPWPTTC